MMQSTSTTPVSTAARVLGFTPQRNTSISTKWKSMKIADEVGTMEEDERILQVYSGAAFMIILATVDIISGIVFQLFSVADDIMCVPCSL